MATVVGSAFLGVAVTSVGKQVFLLIITTIPNAMLCMMTTADMVQKAAFGRKKSPPLAVKKQLIASPLSIPNRQEFILAVFKEIVVHTFPLKKVGNGLSLASLQVSRLTVGVILNLIISSYPFLFIFLLLVTPTANRNSYRVAVGCVPSTMDFPHIAIGCVPSTMYFGLKLHTENLIIIPHGMPWGIIVFILMTPALPCLLFPLIKFTNHGIIIHILRN